MPKEYDLIVVGAGPAGLMAARTAAENGLAVALIERKSCITEINRACSMMVTKAWEISYSSGKITLKPGSNTWCAMS